MPTVEANGRATRPQSPRLSIESLPHGFLEFDRDGRPRRWNSRLPSLLGIEAAELGRHPLWTWAVSPESAGALRQALAKRQFSSPLTLGLCLPKPGLRWLRFDWLRPSSPARPAAALVSDVTAAQEHTQRLRAQRRRVTDFVHTLDAAGRYIECDEASAILIGHRRDELLGRDFRGLVSPEWVANIERVLQRVLQGEEIEPLSWRRASVDGDDRHLEVFCLPYVANGRICGVTCIGKDVTERVLAEEQLRESEARYRSLFEQSLDGIFLHSDESDGAGWPILAANPAACRILGRSEDELRRMGTAAFLDFAPQHPAAPAIAAERARTGIYHGEFEYRRPDDTRVPVEMTSVKLRIGDAQPYSSVVFRDISERKAAVQALLQSREQIRQLWRVLQAVRETEQKRLTQALQDDHGQIIAALKLELGQLKRHLPPTPKLQDKVTDVEIMIDAALDSSRQLAADLRPRALDDFGLIGACEGLLRDFSRAHAIRHRLEFSHPELALSDAVTTGVFRIIEEALDNVGRHARAREVALRFELKPASEGLRVKITDDGRGFDPEATLQGFPLGLLEMQERVKLLRGRLEIISAPGAGTTIQCEVPLGSDTADELVPPPPL